MAAPRYRGDYHQRGKATPLPREGLDGAIEDLANIQHALEVIMGKLSRLRVEERRVEQDTYLQAVAAEVEALSEGEVEA